MENRLGKKVGKFSMAKAVILFLSFLLITSTLGVSLSLFRDNTTDEQSNDFAPIVLSDDSFSTLKSQVSVDMLGKSILVQPVSFVVSKDTSSSVYVRACINFDGIANDARQKIAYESITAATPVLGKSYKWTRFGEYYYLCDSSNQLVALTSANSGEVFNLLEKEANIVPEDIVDEKFAGGEKLNLNVTLQSVQTSKVSSKNVEAAHSAFNAVETTLANTKQQCKLYFYDADGLLLGNQTVAYGKGVTIPTPSAQTGKNLIGWNTRSDYTGATLDEEDLSSVYEDLVLYAEFDALTYNVTVIQPTDELGNSIGTIVPGSTTIRYGQSMTFRVIPNANYYIYGVYINDKNIGSVSEFILSGQTSDVVIRADISQEVIFLDINGGSGTQPRITFNEDKTKFVLSEIEPTGPSGKEFYYYSTNPLDNEQGQNGIRIDLGVEYPLSYLEGNKVLYAIYLTPTADYQTATDYIVVPKNVTSIQGVGENNMFGIDTSEVKFVTLPRSVKKIGNGSFRNLDGLTGLSMSTVVDSIGEYAFENCVSLEQFAFGPFVNKIGDGAFKNCVSLSTLKNFENIPTTELVGTFENCAMLTNVTLPSVVTRIERTFKNCSNLLEVVLPDGLRNIEESSFENCASLSYIEIPSSVSFFGPKTFRNCVSLIAVYGLKDVVAIEISASMFENCVSLQQLNIPSNTAVIGDRAFYACSALQSINNLSVVKVGEVCEEAFAKCTNLKELIFSGSVKTVGARAFADSGVEKVSLSQRLSTLGEGAFENCARLSSVQNLGIITNIPQNTFKNCSSLFSVSIPATVTNVGTLAFENCSSLTNLSIPASVQTIEVDALKNATGLKSITLQGDLASVYNLNSTKQNWYHNTIQVETLNEKGYYTTIVSDWIVSNINGNNYIIGYRGNKKDVSIPYTITNEIGETTYIYGVALGQYTDSNFTGFENVVLEEGIQAIFNIDAKNANDSSMSIVYPCFKGMKTLKSITLPTTLSSISSGAFADCSNLTEVIGLENTKITKLGDIVPFKTSTLINYDDLIVIDGKEYRIKYNDATDNMHGVFQSVPLKSIKLPANLQLIGDYCFFGAYAKEITIPATVRCIGAYAFCGLFETISGLENCVLDYKTTINGKTVDCGFAAFSYKDGKYVNVPVFYGLLIKNISLPAYATIYAGDSVDVVFAGASLIANCPSLESITMIGDWSQKFSLATTEESDLGINSYQWYLNGKQVSTAMEAGTYTIFPGADDSDWVVDENGMIIAYKGSNTTATVPASVVQNGKTVQVVGVKSFKNSVLMNVTLSEGITKIDSGAFANMTKLKNVKLANSISEIGDGAFKNCSSLVSVVLPEKAKTVGSDIFRGCSSIKIIVLNSNITTEQTLADISDGDWFHQSSEASTVVLSMKSKGIYSKYSSIATTSEWEVKAYDGKNYITAYLGSSREIIVPTLVVESDYSNIYEIYGLAALKKFNFTSIVVSEGIEALGLNITDGDQMEMAYLTLGLLDIDTGMMDLPFMHTGEGSDMKFNDSLTKLVLPDSLDIVGLYGLAGVKLKGSNTLIELKNISVLDMGALGLVGVDEIRINLNATKTLLSIGEDAFNDSTARIITIGYGPTTIGNSAFRNCANLTEINLPASIVTIEDNAFSGCSSLVELNLKNARQIGSISNCSSLEKIILGASLYNPYAVSNISGKNGNTWFYEGGSDTAVSYFDLAGTYLAEKPDLSSVWTYEQINGKWYITGYTGNSVNLTVPSSLVINGIETQISGIKSINTNDGVEIESLVISEGISEILENALSGKTKLAKITLPSTLTSIGAGAFSSTAITLLTLACDSLTLSAGAFDGMNKLEIINVQSPVNSAYTLPSEKTWTYISYDEANNQSSSTLTTTLLNKGIYTTLANVATTNEWIVGSENNSYFIAGYKLDHTDSTKTLEIPRLVINHKTFEVYEISSIKSLYMKALTNTNVEISLKISEGITKIDTRSYSYSFNDVIGEYFSINQSLRGNGNNIVSIELPTTLLELGDYAFAYLYHLKEIKNLENTQIKELKQNAFYNNYDLTQLVFPITLKEINSNNFSSCSDLNKITLKTNLNSTFNLSNVGNGIWYYNSETIKTVTMQKAGIYSSSPIQTIGLWVVELIDGKNYITGYLGGATELVVPHELFDEQQGEIVQIYGVRGIGKTDLTSITFEEGIEEVGEMSASGNIFGGECTNLSKISMPSTLTTIYDHALDNISAENIVITIFGSQTNAYTLSSIKDTTWYYGNANVTIMQTYGSYMTFKVEAYMPDETTMGKLVSENAAKRNEIVNEAGYGNIDNAWYVFDNETDGKTWCMYGYLGSKSEIVVPHYVMDYFTIANVPIMREISCFMGLVKDALTQEITKITLEEGYTTFGVGEAQGEFNTPAMTGSMGTVKEVKLPSTLTQLGVAAFVGFISLEKVNLEDTKLTTIPMYAFIETLSLKKIILPTSIKKIEMLAFYGSGLVELELNEGLISMDSGAFAGLVNLKVLTIPSSISSIQENILMSSEFGEAYTLSSLEKIVIKKDLSTALQIQTITKNVYYKNGSQIALSTISEAGTYLSYLCGTTDDWTYETVDGKNYITSYVGKNLVVDVPSYIWDRATGGVIEIYGVKSLNNSKIRKLTIREGIKSVGNGTNNIINGTYNNTLTYVSIASSVVENDAHILDDCFALESINLFGNLQNELTTSSIKPVTWYSHNEYWKIKMVSEDVNSADKVTTISLAGGYSTYSIGQNLVQAKPAKGGFGADLWIGETGTDVNAFVPAFGLFMPSRLTPGLIDTISQEQMAQLVPMDSVISLRGYVGSESNGFSTVAKYSKNIVFNSITFAEGITRIGDNGNKNNGVGAGYALYALGPVVNKVNKVGSEDKINLLPFDGSFESGSVPSAIAKDGGTLSLSNSAYAGSKALSYSKSGASKATITTQLEAGVYVFEAMVKSSNADAPLQVQLSSSGSNYSIYYSDVHKGDGNYKYVFVKFEVQSSMAANLNLIQSATYDCMSLYRVDRGLPTTLTVLGANAFSCVSTNINHIDEYETTGLSSINLSQTAIEEIEMFGLNATFENSGLNYQYSNGKYFVDGTEVRTDWSFDAKSNTLTIANTNVAMVESSEDMFWGGGYTYNAKTNRLTSSDGIILTDRYYVQDGELKKDILIAIPRTLTTLGHLALNTGATRYVGLEKSVFRTMEVSAFGGAIRSIFSEGSFSSETFGDNLVKINLPKTFEEITYSTSSDIALGPMLMFNMGMIGDGGENYHFPTDYVGYGFAGNRGLQNIYVDSQNPVFSSKDGVLFNANQTTIISFPIGRKGDYVMPDSVKVVGEAAFITSSLSSVTISSSLEEIQDYGFAGMTASHAEIGSIAEFVGLESSNLRTIGRGAFATIPTRTLSFPSTLVSVGDTEDLFGTPFGGGAFELIITRSALTKPVSLAYNDSGDGWYYNFSSKVENIQPAGIYSKKLYERDWKVEEIDGKYWIVAYLGEETNLSVPSVTLNDMGELVEIYGIKSLNYSNVSSLDVASGIKAFGYAGDSTNILGSTSDTKLASIEINGRLESMTENSLMGLGELTCLNLAWDLESANSFAPTGRTTWYHYNDGASEVVSTYQTAGIYTSSQLQRENEEWVVDSDGYIIAYKGTKTELVVPSHLLRQDSDNVIIVKGIKSFSNIKENDYFWDSNNNLVYYSDTLCNVTSVTISEGIKTIESQSFSAFRYLTNVVEINLCSTLTYIGENAFKACEILEEITIPSGVKEVAVSALPMDKNLQTINLEANLKTIFEIPDSYGSWFYNSEPTRTETMYVKGVYKKLLYTIVYDGNGATMSDGRKSFTQEGILQGKEINLADNSFVGTSLFLGWSKSADSLYAEYQAGDQFILGNSEVVETSDYSITLYAIWQRTINIATLDNGWKNSNDSGRGYNAIKFGTTTDVSSTVSIDLSKEIVMTGSFKIATLGQSTRLISLMNGSTGIELYSNTSNKIQLKQNNSVVLTSTNNVVAGKGYSYFIYKSYGTISMKILNEDGSIFFDDSTSAQKMTGTSATYTLGYSSNQVVVTYGTAMLFESTVLKLEFLPIAGQTTSMTKIDEGRSEATINLTNPSGCATSVINVVKMIPTSEGSVLPKENAPTRFGYVFDGYYSELGTKIYDANMNVQVSSYPYIGDKTLTANWTPIDFTITYNANGGFGSYTQTVHYDMTFRAYDNGDNKITRVGYTISGWATSEDGTVKYGLGQNDCMFDNKGNLTLYAIWQEKTYTVTIDPNGGAYSGNTQISQDYLTSATINDPTRKGYRFAGWVATKVINGSTWAQVLYHNNVAGTQLFSSSVDLSTKVVNDSYRNSQFATLAKLGLSSYEFLLQYDSLPGQYNQWVQTSNPATNTGISGYSAVKISWSSNSWGGIAKSSTPSNTFIDGSPSAGTWYYALGSYLSWGGGIPGPAAGELNKVLLWLKTDSTLSNFAPTEIFSDADAVGSNNTYCFKDEEVTLKALWIPNTYTVTYNGNGATSGSTASSSHTYDVAKNLTTNGFARTGYTFVGWSTSSSGSVKYSNGASVKNLTETHGATVPLYAVWTANKYTVTYNTNGGSTPSPASNSIAYDSNYTLPSNPTKTGYTFAGWVGKNLFNKSATAYKTGYYVRGADGFEAEYSAYNIYEFQVPAGAKITIKNSGQSTSPGYAFYTSAGAYISGANFGNKSVVTATVPSNAMYIHVSVNLGEEYRKDIDYFQVEIGSSATTYESYKTVTSSTKMTTAHDHTLMALWTPIQSTISWSASDASINANLWNYAGSTGYTSSNGGSNSSYSFSNKVASSKATYGQYVSYTTPIPNRLGYTFSGWFTASSGGTKVANADGTFALTNNIWNISGNTTLYAQWTKNTYTISYDYAGGTKGTNAPTSYSFGTSTAISNPTRTGYTFAGWKVTSTLSGKQSGTINNGNGTLQYDVNYPNAVYFALFYQVANVSYTGVAQSNTSGQGAEIRWRQYNTSGTYKGNGSTSTTYSSTTTTFTSIWYHLGSSQTTTTISWNQAKDYSVSANQVGNLTLVAKWTANTYTVTFNPNGGTVSPTTATVTYDSTYGSLPTPTRTGYTFAGWWTAASGGTQITSSTKVTTASNHSIYAHWTANTYTVTFDPNGGTVSPTTATVTYDSTYGSLPTPTRTGYTFAGWWTAASGGTQITSSTKVTTASNHSIYAHWTPKTYHVTYNSNGGTGNDYEVDIVYGETFVLLDPTDSKLNYSRDDHVFSYWSMNQDGSETGWKGWIGREWSWGYDHDVTFYAQWNRNYHIIYNANGGSGATMSETIVASGQHCVISQNTYTKIGYTFSHWAELYPDGTYRNNGWTGWSGTWQWANGDYSISDYKLNFYAIWTANTYTVTANANGGTIPTTSDWTIASDSKTATKTVTYDSTYGTLPTPTRTGYTFAGWFTAASNGTQITSSTKVTTASNHSIYAHWTANKYTVKFNANGGSGTMADQKFTYGTAQNLTANAFTRTGYKFTGWATSATGSKIYNDKQSVNNLTTTANGTFNLYARWDKIHKITFNKNGGTGGTSELWFYVGGSKFYTNSTCTTELPNQKITCPTKNGYDFWCYTNDDGSHVAFENDGSYNPENEQDDVFQYDQDFSFTASWTAKTYTVTANANGGTIPTTSGWTVASGSKTATKTVTYDSTYGTLPTPTRVGYTFAGWYTAASGGTQVTSSTKVTTASNHSIYAHWSAKTYYVSTGGNQVFTVNSSGKFDQALSISWAEKNTAQYKYTMSKITIYSGTGKTGTVLKTFTSGSSGTFTMSKTYYSDIYIWADTTQSERIFTVTITSTNSTWTENSSTKMTLDIGAHTSTSLSSNTSKTFQVKYNQEIWMNLALTGFSSKPNHVDWSMSTSSLLTVGDNSGANYSGGSFNKGTSSGGYLRTASGSSSTANTWMRWIFKSTASTSDSSSCLTITIHNYKYSSGGGSLCCVDGDSEIAMADGTTKAIKNIKVGDMVLSYDEVNKVLAPTAVERIDVVRRSEILHITFADGTMLKITPDHPMFSERGWVVHDPESAKIAYSDVDIREEIVCIGDMLLSLSLLFDK